MTHTDLGRNDEPPNRDDHSEPGTSATSRSQDRGASTSPDQSATQPGNGPATAQTASASDPTRRPEPAPSEHVAATQQAAARRGAGWSAPDGESRRTQLLAPEELQGIAARWRDIQAGFVDEPRRAVMDADALVADLMQRLARMFAAEREELQSRWMSDQAASTEDLRQGLRRYRLFFEHLLAI
jgi:hypothetical protein